MAITTPRPTAAPARANRPAVSRKTFAATVGRYQGPELFYQQPFTALTSPIIPKQLNLTRPAESIKIVWRGRVVIGTAAINPVAAEAPQTIIQRIRITGTHRLFNALVPIDITGPTAFAWCRLFQQRGSSLIINGTRQADPGVPFAQAAATFGNVGTYDLEIHYDVPLTPLLGPGDTIQTTPYLWYPQDWADTIQVQLYFNDGTAFGTLGTATVAFSQFGGAGGSPTVNIYVNYAILGGLAASFNSGTVVRNEQTTVGGVAASIANNVRMQLLQKNRTLNVVLKTGTILSGTSAGVQVFQTLVDTMLDSTQIVVDNKPVRNNFSNYVAKEYAGRQFNTIEPGGYLPFTFVDSLLPTTMLHGEQIPGGSTFELDSNILTAGATQAFSVVQEQVFSQGDPGALAG